MRREVAPKKEDWGSVSQRLAALERSNLDSSTREEQRELWESSITRRVSELETYAEGMLPVMQRLQCCEDYIGLSGTHTPFNASKSTDIFTRITRLENPFELLATREWVKERSNDGLFGILLVLIVSACTLVATEGYKQIKALQTKPAVAAVTPPAKWVPCPEYAKCTTPEIPVTAVTGEGASSSATVEGTSTAGTTVNQFVVSAGTLPAEIHPTEGTQIEVTWLKPCWVSYTDQIGKVTQVGNVEGGYVGNYFVFGPITIRSVCPGYVRYRVNGKLVSPPNLSRTPEKSEVVTLPEAK